MKNPWRLFLSLLVSLILGQARAADPEILPPQPKPKLTIIGPGEVELPDPQRKDPRRAVKPAAKKDPSRKAPNSLDPKRGPLLAEKPSNIPAVTAVEPLEIPVQTVDAIPSSAPDDVQAQAPAATQTPAPDALAPATPGIPTPTAQTTPVQVQNGSTAVVPQVQNGSTAIVPPIKPSTPVTTVAPSTATPANPVQASTSEAGIEPSATATKAPTDKKKATEIEAKPDVGGNDKIPAITNLDELAKQLKLDKFKEKKFGHKIKIAVLDNGFHGYEKEIGKTLPANTQYHTGAASAADSVENKQFHGLFMAQILSMLIQKSGAQADYELHLINSYGITKFTDAVNTVIQGNFDVVLYAQVWEYGGNGDGKGFINALVDKATQAGIVWVNAAGNFGHLTKVAPVSGTDWVDFKNKAGKIEKGVTILCKAKAKETCPLRLVLAWNDFKDTLGEGTNKDLDLFLFDSKNKQLQSSELQQKTAVAADDKTSSLYPREFFELAIKPGSYKVRVKIKSKNFDKAVDELRVTASGKGIEMAEASVGETLLPPADNPNVIVVGASDDFQTSQSKLLRKPDINVKSLVKLKDGSQPFSTSNASAMIAAVTVLELGTGTNRERSAVLAAMSDLKKPLTEIKEQKPEEKETPVASNGGTKSSSRHGRGRATQRPSTDAYGNPYYRGNGQSLEPSDERYQGSYQSQYNQYDPYTQSYNGVEIAPSGQPMLQQQPVDENYDPMGPGFDPTMP